MNVKTPSKVDSWIIQSTGNGLQVRKNRNNIYYATSFDKAWQYIKDHGTPGDRIDINVVGTLAVS